MGSHGLRFWLTVVSRAGFRGLSVQGPLCFFGVFTFWGLGLTLRVLVRGFGAWEPRHGLESKDTARSGAEGADERWSGLGPRVEG